MRTLLAITVVCVGAVPCRAADPPAKTDRYGDPLPAGALMRYGTLRTRAPITGFGIEKDGTVVTVGPSVDVRRWHAVDDRSDDPIVLPLKGPQSSNNSPQVSPDGKLVAACSAEKVFVWETPADAMAKPKEVAAFEIARPRLFRFSPDGSTLAVTTEGWNNLVSTVLLCELKTGKVRSLEGVMAQYLESVGFSGDGKRVAAVGSGKAFFWDATTEKKLAEYRAERHLAGPFALDRTGELFVAQVYADGGKIESRFMDALTGKTRDGMAGPEGARWVAFAPDGKSLLIGDLESVRWWDTTANKLIRKFDGIASDSSLQSTPARFTPDGKTLVAHNGRALLRWDAKTGKALFAEQDIGHGGYVRGIGVSSDGKRIATRGMDSRVCVWDAATGKELWHAPAAWTGSSKIDFSPDRKFLCVGGPKWGEATKYEATTGKVLLTFVVDPKEPKQASVDSLRLSRDGKILYGLTGPSKANDPALVTTWDAATGERQNSTRVPFRAIIGGELSPNGAFVDTGELMGRGVIAVAAPERNLLADAKLKGFALFPGQFSDDGKWLTRVNAENSQNGFTYSAVVVSTLTWRAVATIPLLDDGRVALAPDGRTLAVAVGENLEFHDCATGKTLGSYLMPAGRWARTGYADTPTLRFTPDGTKLITGQADTTVLVWPVPQLAK